MPLVYLPDIEALFAYREDALGGALPALLASGTPHAARLVLPDGIAAIEGQRLSLVPALEALAVVPAAVLGELPASVAVWALASKLVVELVARERILPAIARRAGRVEARWAAALGASEDAERIAALARSMPPAAHAVPVRAVDEDEVWAPDALLRAYIDAAVDALVRARSGGPQLPVSHRSARPQAQAWEQRWQTALGGVERGFEAEGFAERGLVDALERWSAPALGARDRLRACFRLELPPRDRDPFVVRFLLQPPDDPSLLVPASEVWSTRGRSLQTLGRAFRDPQESLLEALGRASRLYPPLEAALQTAAPELLTLDAAAAYAFLAHAGVLAEAGFGVILPSELTAAGQRRLRLRMRVGQSTRKVAGAVSGSAGLGLDELVEVNWEAVLGDRPLAARELAALAKHKAPLVRFRGVWVAVDPEELAEIQRRMASGPERIAVRDALQVALAGEVHQDARTISVLAEGGLADVLERLRAGGALQQRAPSGLRATLRPYQERGLNWLSTMASLGLGACLADDMGLGKTMQLLALLLQRAQQQPDEQRPSLLVAPTSVVGNWEREIERFAPELRVAAQYGAGRARTVGEFPRGPGTLVITSYGLLRRDAALLCEQPWSVVVLDEAQNIKNAASATARAACDLRADQRIALTGTPVENRLAELWSILEFANPGLLGPLATFRRQLAIPIERYADENAAARLRRMVSPFVLRRVKSDPSVIADLPPKNEMKVVCTLTREQATLYKALVDEELRVIEDSEGMERRGRVLALLTHTKQVCNHPAHYLGESGPLAHRSGKLARLTEMLEEALAAGDKALVFTQFREMGERLVRHLHDALGEEVLFLHGGTQKRARDLMVERFNEAAARGPRIFVLSLKAGGTGLNLTAASHVFHFDRWWNPAVEDQATDRAYRIGQTRSVQVHKLLCAGTVEEKIDRLLEHKRGLAAKVVGAGEQWITELEGDALRELFELSSGAVAAGDDDTDAAEVAAARPAAPRRRRKEARS